MTDSSTQAARFRALHVPGDPVVLFNVWDAGSAKAVAEAGALALATGSWSVAAAHGYADGEQLPFDLALANARRIVAASDLPVSLDIESGYGDDAASVGRTVASIVLTGVVGCNLEDSYPDTGKLRPLAEQVERLREARAHADVELGGFFINARTDVFFQAPAEAHDGAMLQAALKRARAYADIGANGVFVPGLVNLPLIAAFVAASPLPVNIMMGAASPPLSALRGAGVARVSHGPGPYRSAMAAVTEAARAALA